MALRTDNVSGIITGVFGVVMAGFAGFGLLIVALQRVMLSAMPPFPHDPSGVSVVDAMHAIHGVWFVFFPLMIAGGIVFAVSGFYVRRGSLAARRVAQANAILGYVWLVAYMASCHRVSDRFFPPPDLLPMPAAGVLQWVSLVMGTLMGAAFPTGLLFILSRPREQIAAELPTTMPT
jgi:hypothetical protein